MNHTIRFTSLLVSFLFTLTTAAATIRGTVVDPLGSPVSGAVVSIGQLPVVRTAADGSFVLDAPPGPHDLRISHPGFEHSVRRVAGDASVSVTLLPAFSETMEVSAIRAGQDAPVTKTDIDRAEIEERYHGQDVPLLLRDAPSIHAFSESGAGGAGYSYITLRGASSSRINFTLDGVPLSDSEDMTTYFVDFPDLARSLESVQIQRGVGTSTFGAAAFAGSVNLESIAHSAGSRTEVTLGAGSFNGTQASVGYHSGALASGFSFYTRLSLLESDGYRDHSATEQRNLFFSGSKQLGAGQLKLTGFAGHMAMQSSYYATDAATLETDPRYNPLRPEENDSFSYDLAQLQYILPMGSNAAMTASAYYQRGYGGYRLFDSTGDALREYGLDGMLLGSMLTYSKVRGALETNYGVHVNRFRRDHTRDDLTAGVRNYANYGVKQEANAFAKASYQAGRWNLHGDAQVRHATFEYHGAVAIEPVDWTFFNPKVGVRFAATLQSSFYASAGLATREPARNDMFLGEDDPTVAHDLHAVRPERLVDFEAGWNYRRGTLDLTANVYAMEFRNEIAATGEQSEIGLALRRNVDRSSRRGIELDAAWEAGRGARFRTTASLSRNRIRDWTQFYDVYDDSGTWTGTRSVQFRDVEPLLTPSVIVSQSIDYAPLPRLTAGLTGRYVGRSWLDNTNDPALTAPSHFLLDARVSHAFRDDLRVSLTLNNVLDDERVYPSGYSYLYFSGDVRSGTAYYYPHATRSAVILIDFAR